MQLECEQCGEETLHRVLRARKHEGKTKFSADVTVRCSECKTVHKEHIDFGRRLSVPVLISWQDKTEKASLEFNEDDIIEVGAELYWEYPLLIMSIEADGRRVKEAKADEIDAIWTKRFDKVLLKVSVTRGKRTTSHEIEALPDDEFTIGDIITIGRSELEITSIKIEGRSLRKGSAIARSIVRVYTKPARSERRSYQ